MNSSNNNNNNNNNSSLPFDGKVAVITGSGTGIGQAIAKKFSELGASVIIMGRRKEPLNATVKILEEIIRNAGSSGRARAFPGIDVSDEKGITQMFDEIRQEFGRVDILVNNAGVSGPVRTFPAQPYKEFRDCVSIHLTGTFWTSVQALRCMEKGAKIITISTFFTEERPFEQRPYRFRSPYTAAQGAKNRLAEALAWELSPRGIRSIATNPGPVHSDRIYKTVYPKAAAEFIRIGGFPGLKPTEVEKVTVGALPMLGESEEAFGEAVLNVANDIAKQRGGSGEKEEVENLARTVRGCLGKMQEVAEKIQANTSKMIVDGQFLSQEETAEIVINLAGDEIGRLVSGRVMPADRVFYPVRPLISCGITPAAEDGRADLRTKVAIFTVASTEQKDHARVKEVADAFAGAGAKCVLLFSKDNDEARLSAFKNSHMHLIDLGDEEAVRKVFGTASSKFGRPAVVLHFTGDFEYGRDLSKLARNEWDILVDRYINMPALVGKEAINAMVSGALEEPQRYRESSGTIIIIGPGAPSGQKIPGLVRARAEVFRGALRPFTATVNQELCEVLKSPIRLYLVLPGSIEGREPDAGKLVDACLYLASERAGKRFEVIYHPDETRAS